MTRLYRYVGLVKKTNSTAAKRGVPNPRANQNTPQTVSKSNKAYNTMIDLVTMVKRNQINYSENNGSFLPGYLQTHGFIGTLKPSFGYTFGSQRNIRQLAARNGWLTVLP